ncbi:MAG: histidinol-phosphate transaminase [bacterium]
MSKWDVSLRVVEAADQEELYPALHAVTPNIPVARAVASLSPYEAVSSQRAIEALGGTSPIFKLDWNEATIPPSPNVQKVLANFIAQGANLNWYPELGSRSLLLGLSDYTGVRPESLMVTNGSDDALHLICSSFLDHGDEVVVPVPTYNHFIVFAQAKGATVRQVVGESPFSSNISGIRAALSQRTRMLYLVSPNNPTGVLTHPDEVAAIARDYPNLLILLDEAYFEFAQVSGIELVEQFSNVIVTRTFSKAFGLAGLRVGYLAAHPSVIDGLSRLYNPKSVNTMAQIGALAAIEDREYLNAYLEDVTASKELLRQFFATRRNVEAWITPANFVVVRTGNIQQTLKRLESLGVYVRDRSTYPGLEGCLRMTVGTVEQTQRLLERLSKVF